MSADDDAEQAVAKQPQQQPHHEPIPLASGSAILNTEDYESIPEDEWIASDMTMYDSPLAELERQHCYMGDNPNILFPSVSVSSSDEHESAKPEENTSLSSDDSSP